MSSIIVSSCYPQRVDTPPAYCVRVLKRFGGQSVWLIERPGETRRTLKSWALTPVMLLKLVLGIAQPQRQVRGARRAARAGVQTPRIVRAWRLRLGAPGPRIELEHDYVDGKSAMEVLEVGALPDDACREVSAAVGRVVACLDGAGLFNRDLKLSNLILDAEDGRPRVWLIDTVGIRRMHHRVAETARMLERLAVEPAELGIALSPPSWVPAMRHALRGLAAPARRAVVERLKEHRRRRSA